MLSGSVSRVRLSPSVSLAKKQLKVKNTAYQRAVFLFILVAMHSLLAVYFFAIGLCFGSFALATAWRIKKNKNFTKERSECERCHHVLAPRDLLPLVSWLAQKGKCRYCHKKLSVLLPLAELVGGIAFSLSYLVWPEPFDGFVAALRFAAWCVALVLLLILFFYDLQWYKLPNKVIYPLWAVSGFDFLLRLIQEPTLVTLLMGVLAVTVGAGLFFLLYVVSKGKWIGFGDVRLGLAIGLLTGKPLLAALVIFAASLLGVLVALPSLLSRKKGLTSKLPFGPLLIIGLILVRVFGQRLVDWYASRILFL